MKRKVTPLYSPYLRVLPLLFYTLFFSVYMMASSSSSTNSLRILQWNCRSIFTNIDQLQQELSENFYDILALQSVGTVRKPLPYIQGYYTPYKNAFQKGDKKIRTAFYVKKGITSSLTKIKGISDSLAITIEMEGNDPVTIINTYLPTGVENETHLDWLKNLKQGRFIIIGDFNAKSNLWDPCAKNSDLGGTIIENILDDNINVCLLNDGSITRIPDRPGDKPSAIDLSFCSTPLFFKLRFETLNDTLGSDHFPILLTLEDKPKQYALDDSIKFNYSKADWNRFKDLLSSIQFSEDFSNPELWYKNFQEIVMNAAINSIPQYNHNSFISKPNRVVYWNDACQASKVAFRKAKKKYCREQSDENEQAKFQARSFHNQTMAKAEQDYWSNYLKEKVKSYKDAGIVYKKLRKIKGQYDPPEKPLEVDGKRITDPKEKANIFASTFASVSQNNSLTNEQAHFRFTEENNYETPSFTTKVDDNDFTLIELNKALLGIKTVKKATGIDPISYSMIKQFPPATKEIILKFFNTLWQNGYVLESWKKAQVSAIPKPGKPSKDPSSYRPISLTPHISKIYERLIANRLDYFIEKKNIIPLCQSGFRRGRSCIENLTKISAHVKKAMMQRRPVMAAFFDIKRAFDTVWHRGLLNKLYQAGISKNLYRFFESFLQNRTIQVKVGPSLSEPHVLEMGIPQGSIVAPTAFSIMLSDIVNLNLKESHISLYADDLAMWSTSKYRRTNIDRFSKGEMSNFQDNIKLISNYMSRNGFTLSPQKTVFMIFTNCCRVNKEIYIEINGTKIYPSQEVKYLGVTLDKSFTFNTHIKYLISKTRKNMNLIKILKKEKGFDSLTNLKLLINALIRSRLRYGEEIFCSANPSLVNRLQQCETSIIKKLLDIPNHANPLLVYREIGLIPLSISRQTQTARTVFRLGTTENDLSEEISLAFNNVKDPGNKHRLQAHPRQFSRAVSVMNFVQPIIQEAEIGDLHVNMTNSSRYFCRPWNETDMMINYSLLDLKKSEDPNLLKAAAFEMLHEHQDFFKLYTDGSLNSGGSGCAFVAPSNSYSEKYKLNEGISIFSAELCALEKALEYAYSIEEKKILILSDSRSVLQTIKLQSSPKVTYSLNLIHRINKQGKTLKLQWIPSHMGIVGNELADCAAKAAASDPLLPITNLDFSLSEIYCKLDKAGEALWKKQFQTCATHLNWLEPDKTKTNSFTANKETRDAFLRLRCKVTKFEIFETPCVCVDATFCVSHIFECSYLRNSFENTLQICNKINLPFNYPNVMSYNPALGWDLTKTFIDELLNSDAGHLM